MKALLIDPSNQTITEIEFDGGLEAIYKIMECNMVEAPIEFENGDILWCDEEGKLKYEDEIIGGITYTKDWYDVITGKCLVTGIDEEGDTCDCKSTPDYIKTAYRGFRWVTKDEAVRYLEMNGFM